MTILTKPGAATTAPRQFSEIIQAEAGEPEPEPIVATVDDTGDALRLVDVSMADIETLADATRRYEARKLDYEDRVRYLRECDPKLAEIMEELEASKVEMNGSRQKVEAGLTFDDRMEGTARLEIEGLIKITFPTPQLRFKSKLSLRDAFEREELREAMGIYQEPTKPPRIRVEVQS